jgi:hypothetical protein
VGIGEHPPSGLNSFSQNKFYPFRDPDAPQPVRDAGYLADVISRIVNGHPQSRLDELLPWAYPTTPALKAAA